MNKYLCTILDKVTGEPFRPNGDNAIFPSSELRDRLDRIPDIWQERLIIVKLDLGVTE